jgi:hypothetical protein
MFVKTKKRRGRPKPYFYLMRSKRDGKKVLKAELYLGPTLSLPAERWLELIEKSNAGDFPRLTVRNFLIVLEPYVRQHSLPENTLAGLKEAVRLTVTHAPAYQVLGLRPGASPRDVQQSFRRLSRQHHPDFGGDPAKFRQLVRARDQIGTVTPTSQKKTAQTAV